MFQNENGGYNSFTVNDLYLRICNEDSNSSLLLSTFQRNVEDFSENLLESRALTAK